MNWIRTGLIAALAIGFVVLDAEAKHICPRIPPVEIDGIRFIAPNNQGFRGYVRATDAKTGTNLWEKTIYRVIWRFPLPELDLYYCVITGMKAKDGRLLIQNDRDKWYSLDPKTRRVKRITAAEATGKRKDEEGQPSAPGYSPPADGQLKPEH